MTRKLEGKVALVTGGASGIGRASALAFAREGARVVVNDLMIDGGKETVEMIRTRGGEAAFLRADVAKAADVETLVSETISTFGGLDCAFNNAGVEAAAASTSECSEEDWERVINVNLKGIWLCMKYELIYMSRHNGGSIVNTSSIAGLVAFKGRAAYVASKHGVIGLTKSAALEYAGLGIRVNAVCPGITRTSMVERIMAEDPGREAARIAMIPIGRLGVPEDIAEAVVWLCSDSASYITGHALVIDGGWTISLSE